jgi:hypothetical protein
MEVIGTLQIFPHLKATQLAHMAHDMVLGDHWQRRWRAGSQRG